jgi:hypothetical protein
MLKADSNSDHVEARSKASLKKQRPSSTFVSKWLLDNFVEADDSHIAREALYKEYVQFAEAHSEPLMNSASLGKIVRSVFPSIATRRLGTRGNSKYHYYGVKPKFDYDSDLVTEARPPAKKVRNSLIEMQVGTDEDAVSISSSISSSNAAAPVLRDPVSPEMIKDFLRLPVVDMSKFSPDLNQDLLAQFLDAYRAHCEFLLQFGLQGNFDGFGNSLVSFWKDAIEPWSSLFVSQAVGRLVSEWDAQVYQAMLNVFLPDILGPGDKDLMKGLRDFSRKLIMLLETAFDGNGHTVCAEKTRVAADFVKIVKQYSQLNKLALSANQLMSHRVKLEKMLRVWQNLDFESIVSQGLYICPNAVEALRLTQENIMHKLQSRACITNWAEWLYAMTEEFIQSEIPALHDFLNYCQNFMIRWSYMSSIIMREISDKDKDAFGKIYV